MHILGNKHRHRESPGGRTGSVIRGVVPLGRNIYWDLYIGLGRPDIV